MINEEIIRNSFAKMKEHMLYLQQEITILKQEIRQIKHILSRIQGFDKSSTHPQHSIKTSTGNLENYSLKHPNSTFSIGNDGVSTDSQQTFDTQKIQLRRTYQAPKESIPEISQSINNYITSLKKELQDKFKRLTKQEFLIFSVLYTLNEEIKNVTYRAIAQRTRLTESSVRDYISRLEHKGIPIVKEKVNNRYIVLRIPRELKDLTTHDNLAKLKKFDIELE